ncbi:hypothetical protein LGZ99_06370 [Photorhabdus temperata]|uniref:Uncharacterized protein n=2 Tax=Photorhabdus temperata TaxID=574560 RepID=A0A081S0P5_PHOTE|nr:hypothetical protein [Photorhabdus temperata]KER04498.1 hypothetical protein MEG1DRAFT_00787 [Photorhabdus temperata subsp. temperata Meg1]MCT8346846.1 hypothetical protein [Photorhabdus temperata]
MKKLLLLLILVSFSSLAVDRHIIAKNPYPNLTPEQLTQQIKRQGAKMVIANMPEGDNGEWDYITNHIASGDMAWLKIAPLLAKGSDAYSAETLSTALATALPKNASGVLSVLNDSNVSISTESVCSLPFYQGTEAELNQYVIDSIRALYKNKGGEKCLQKLIETTGNSKSFSEGD